MNNTSIEQAILDQDVEALDKLVRDKNLDLDELAESKYFRDVIQLLMPRIHDKAVGFYFFGDLTESIPRDKYRSFILVLILRRPTIIEALEWIVANASQEMSDAARSIKQDRREQVGKIKHTSDLFTAYRGFFLLARGGYSEDIKEQLRREGASREGIALANSLMKAFLGSKITLLLSYNDLYERLY